MMSRRMMKMRASLDLIKERRATTDDKEEDYKRKAVKYFNKRFKSRQFRAEDLVLYQVNAAKHIPRKLDPTWEGHFKVIKIVRPRAYWLEDLNGKPLPRL